MLEIPSHLVEEAKAKGVTYDRGRLTATCDRIRITYDGALTNNDGTKCYATCVWLDNYLTPAYTGKFKTEEDVIAALVEFQNRKAIWDTSQRVKEEYEQSGTEQHPNTIRGVLGE